MKNLFLCSYFNAVADEFKEFAKGAKRICFVPTAANLEEVNFYVDEARDVLLRLGFDVREVDIAKCSKDKFLDILDDSDIIYFSGGNTFYLMDAISKLGIKDDILSFLIGGGLYAGEFAGAVIASKDIRYIGLMDKNMAGLSEFAGLDIVDVYVLPHFGEYPFEEICTKIVDGFRDIPLKPIKNNEFISANFI